MQKALAADLSEWHGNVAPPSPATRFIPLVKWPEFHAYPTLGGLRWLAFTNRDGFRDQCIRSVGRRLLVDEAAFLRWIAAHGETGGA
jgi:hypothetical protein